MKKNVGAEVERWSPKGGPHVTGSTGECAILLVHDTSNLGVENTGIPIKVTLRANLEGSHVEVRLD